METKKVKILAIDDNYDNLIVLNALLEEAFPLAQLITAHSGKTGIELCHEQKPDLILLDIVMPVMDGYEVCRIVKSNEILKNIPIVMVTAARTDREGRIKAIEAGADGFLTKPLDESELIAQVRAMLRIKESEDLKIGEKERLERLVKERTEALEAELRERKKAEKKLQISLLKLEKSKKDNLNLILNLETEIEERKKIEYSLQETNKKYVEAQHIARIGNWEDDLITGQLQWSEEIYKIFGIDRNSRVLLPEILKCFPPDELIRFENALKAALEGHKPYSIDYKVIRPDGKEIYIHDEGEVVRDENGKPFRMFGTTHDITDRKLPEIALTESYQFNNSLLKTIPFGIDIVDKDGNILFMNETFQEWFGHDMIGKKCWDTYREDKTQCKECPLISGIEIGKTNVVEAIGITKGKTFEVSHTGMIYKSEKAMLEIFQDVSERKRNDLIQRILYAISYAVLTTKDVAELSKFIKEQLGQLLDTTNFCIAAYNEHTGMMNSLYMTDQKDDIANWPVAKSLTGYVIKHDRSLLVTNEEIIEMSQRGEIDQIGADCAVWLGIPLHEEGKVIGAFIIQNYDDVNAYTTKDVEFLEFISFQISISIQRKKGMQDLMIALEKAEESDKLKSAFLSNMSHEIRTPMNGILGFSELLNEEELSVEDRKIYLDIINTNGHHLLSIINDILDIARIDSNQLSINNLPFSLHLLLDEILLSYEKSKITIGKENIDFILDKGLKDDDLIIISDEIRLRQILYNLLGNALKFTKNGFIKFGYTLPGDKIQFYIQDSGMGILKENQLLVFERFRQEEETYTRQFGGTGLGLSISKKLTELLGGEMWLVSNPGEGATFYFTIPNFLFK